MERGENGLRIPSRRGDLQELLDVVLRRDGPTLLLRRSNALLGYASEARFAPTRLQQCVNEGEENRGVDGLLQVADGLTHHAQLLPRLLRQ